MEKFNPFNPEYKKVSDLPREEQENFKDVEGGFVKKTAIEHSDETIADNEFLRDLTKDASVDVTWIKQCEQLLEANQVHEIRKVVEDLYFPMRKVLEPVIDSIKKGEYQLLIGEDASGRIPSLIIRKIINSAYSDIGKPEINTRFLAGSTSEVDMKWPNTNSYISDEKLSGLKREKKDKTIEYIKKIREHSSIKISNVLFITEYIHEGRSAYAMYRALKACDINTTILTLLQSPRALYNKQIEQAKNGQNYSMEKGLSIYAGQVGGAGLSSLYQYEQKRYLSGVTKFFADLHAKSIVKNLHGDERKIAYAKMAIARDEANKVADKLIAELLNKED